MIDIGSISGKIIYIFWYFFSTVWVSLLRKGPLSLSTSIRYLAMEERLCSIPQYWKACGLTPYKKGGHKLVRESPTPVLFCFRKRDSIHGIEFLLKFKLPCMSPILKGVWQMLTAHPCFPGHTCCMPGKGTGWSFKGEGYTYSTCIVTRVFEAPFYTVPPQSWQTCPDKSGYMLG